MGVYIKNIEKPKGCWLCTFQIVDPEGGANGCVLDHSIQSADWNEDAVDDCPLIEIDLVRCGECKYAVINKHDRPLCMLVDRTIKIYDFCSYGERRADDKEIL